MTNNISTPSAHYVNTPFGDGGFKGWLKVAGEKPGDALLTVAHAFAKRPGKQTLAHALALRPEGVSGSDIMLVCGAQQLNHMRGLEAAGHFKRDMNAPRNAKGQAVYKYVLTPKGEKALASRTAAAVSEAGEPVKAKVKAKAKKAPSKASKPKVTAPPVNEVQAAVTAAADANVAREAMLGANTPAS